MSEEAPRKERLLDLLEERAVYGLTPEAERELRSLEPEQAAGDLEAFERAAAAIHLSFLDGLATMPEGLQSNLEASARGFSAGTAPRHELRLLSSATSHAPRPTEAAPAPRREGGSGSSWFGWLVAAGILAFFLLPRPSQEPTAREGRDALIATATDLVRAEWSPNPDALGQEASGGVVWSSSRNEGYMTFRGLEANDPATSQYQLWIFDKDRPSEHPVDGGVFDVPAGGGDVVVPIRTQLPVAEPTLFAVTVERPGGVVVSSRERLPLLGSVEGPEDEGA